MSFDPLGSRTFYHTHTVPSCFRRRGVRQDSLTRWYTYSQGQVITKLGQRLGLMETRSGGGETLIFSGRVVSQED